MQSGVHSVIRGIDVDTGQVTWAQLRCYSLEQLKAFHKQIYVKLFTLDADRMADSPDRLNLHHHSQVCCKLSAIILIFIQASEAWSLHPPLLFSRWN
ncbi:hypothetical protein FS842_007451 [Serendipita sp. 407]|nr:hypothetical protein FS842_007451 [Serendipita sp. 407]